MTTPTPDAQDVAPPPLIPPEQLDKLLTLYGTAWVSGYVSAVAAAGVVAGAPDEIRFAMSRRWETHAGHTIKAAIADPITRSLLVATIEHHIAGGPAPEQRGELAIPCPDCDGHRHHDGRGQS